MGSHPMQRKISLGIDSIKLMACILLFYGVLILGKKWEIVHDFQVISLLPLLGVTYYFYKVCKSNSFLNLYENRFTGPIVKTISGLCLEIYLVQEVLFTDKFNDLFPLNLLLVFVIILVTAYILRCMARCFSQTFREADYEWKQIFSVY